MPLFEKAEEISEMKVRLMAISFGFFLVVGLPVTGFAGPVPGGADTDGDGVEDAFDDCTTTANADQADADHNGCGDACAFGTIACDSSGDGKVGSPDFTLFLAQLGNDCDFQPSLSCTADCDGSNDNKVGGPDFTALIAELGNSQGPSGITSALCDPVTCGCTPAL